MTQLRIKSTITEIKKKITGKSILDVGCSGMAHPSVMMKKLQKYSSSYVGIDKEIGAEKFQLGKKFEVITCLEVLEHLDNPSLCLDRVKNHLDDDGLFLLSVPNISSIYHFFLPQSDFHINCWDKKTLNQRLKLHFKFVKIKKINFKRTLLASCKEPIF
jgi:2-polyprenyl-3-methyl-5-hydroxy-6-metoxy-1,4-benzoquinol methylase